MQNYSKTVLHIPSTSGLNQRLENLKSSFGHSIVSKKSSSLSFYYSQLIENSKHCIVALESTFRDALEMNTTYLVGKTLEGETMLLPKQLIEQGNIVTIDETSPLLNDDEPIEESPSVDYLPPQITSVTDILKTPYISQGNVVRCVTGSFD